MTPDLHALTDTPSHAVRQRAALAKRAYTTRRVPLGSMDGLLTDLSLSPRAGDLVLARVEKVGKHTALELTGSRRSTLFVGDEITVVYGARYAPDQFLAELPADLGPCHLAAGGGVAARVVSRHGGCSAPTELQPLGLLVDAEGQRLNLARFALSSGSAHGPRPLTLLSLGTSMNAGKTTAAAHTIKGLVRAGLRVGAAKLTGTGSGNDPNLLRDAGAVAVLDFTDAGHPSTFGLGMVALHGILDAVQAHMAAQQVDVLVAEVADGLLQRETEMLLRSPRFAKRVDGCYFSAGEAMGAIAGAKWLKEHGLPVWALAGTMTRSPLASAEAAQATGLPVMRLDQLSDPEQAMALLRQALRFAQDQRAA